MEQDRADFDGWFLLNRFPDLYVRRSSTAGRWAAHWFHVQISSSSKGWGRRLLKLKVVGFIVADVPTTVEFYEKAFGLALHYMHPSRGYAELNSGSAVLAFLSEEFVVKTSLLGGLATYPNRPDSPTLGAHVALWSDDIEGDWRRAVEAGALVVTPLSAKPWGQISGYFCDRDAILVELCTPSPREMPT